MDRLRAHDLKPGKFTLISSSLFAILSPILGLWFAAIGIMLSIFAGLYLRAVHHVAIERYMANDSWKHQVKVDNQWVSQAELQSLQHILLSADSPDGRTHENIIRLATHPHRIQLSLRLMPLGFIAVSMLGVIAFFGDIRLESKWPNKSEQLVQPPDLIIKWWMPLIVCAICMVVMLGLWIQWRSSFLMVTDWYVYLISLPPIWLITWQASVHRMSYDQMNTAENINTPAGNLVGKILGKGWGTICLDSPATHDEKFNRITWMPNHREVVQIIESARVSYKLMISRSGD